MKDDRRVAYRPSILMRSLVALSVVAMIVMNVLANALPLFGRATGEVSARYPTLVTPAGYVFSIWGLIYIGLIAYSAAQFLGPLRDDTLPDRLAWPMIVSSAANVGWLLLWHSLNIYLTVPVMLVLLASLVVAYRISRADRAARPNALERWAVRAPLGLYLGWISVATIANISGALYAARWSGLGLAPEAWGVVVLVVATGLAIAGLWRERDLVFAGVFAWAFIGIAVATPSTLVRSAAAVLAGVVILGMLAVAIVSLRTNRS